MSNNVRIQDEDRAMLAQREAYLNEEALCADYTEDFARWVHVLAHIRQNKIQINTARRVVFLVR